MALRILHDGFANMGLSKARFELPCIPSKRQAHKRVRCLCPTYSTTISDSFVHRGHEMSTPCPGCRVCGIGSSPTSTGSSSLWKTEIRSHPVSPVFCRQSRTSSSPIFLMVRSIRPSETSLWLRHHAHNADTMENNPRMPTMPDIPFHISEERKACMPAFSRLPHTAVNLKTPDVHMRRIAAMGGSASEPVGHTGAFEADRMAP